MIASIQSQVEEAVEEVLAEIALGEDISYHATLQMAQGPQGPMPLWTLLLAIPSPVLGSVLSTMAIIPEGTPTQHSIRGACAEMVGNLLKQRSSMLGEPEPQPTSSGLILP